MKKVTMLAIALVLSAPVFATDSIGRFVTLGFGTKSCGVVVEAYPKNGLGKLNHGVWVEGYLTAINELLYHDVNVAQGTDPSARDLWIYNYCQKNPLNTLGNAAYFLYLELRSR